MREIEFPLWEKQAQFLDATEPIKGFVAGQGAGKSRILSYDLQSRVKPGRLYLMTAPTYPMLRDTTARTFCEVSRHLGLMVKPPSGESYHSIVQTFSGGTAEILFRSTEVPDRLRGPNLSGVAMDEASLSSYDAYQILLARLREAGEFGWLTAGFTPRGLGHWTYDVFGTGKSGVHLTRAATHENPFLSEDFIATVRANFAGLRARQELGGEFVNVEGAEWPGEYFPESIWFEEWPMELSVKAAALDPSKGKDARTGDYAAFVWGGVDKGGTLWCDADLVREPTPRLVERGLRINERWGPSGFAIETNQFQELLALDLARESRARQLYLPIYGLVNTEKKELRIRRLGPYLARGELRFKRSPGSRLLVQQLRDFPEAEHDDGPDALEQFIRMIRWLLGHRDRIGNPEIVRG